MGSELHSSLRQLGYSKPFGRRIGGYSRSQRAEAKYFLLAMAPMLLAAMIDQRWGRGPLWHVLFWGSAVWAVFIVGAMFAALFKSLAQTFGRKR